VPEQPSKAPRVLSAARKSGELRIIGGQWRSRKIPFAAYAGVRPTPDRVRETVFNWLQGIIPGTQCLDLFAGSGALGFEALSRGANSVILVDQDIRVVQQLQANVETLKATGAQIVWADALEYLNDWRGTQFDIVFLDPPFRDDAITACSLRLEASHALRSPAWIYMESARQNEPPRIPDNWQIIHCKHTGQVSYYLARREKPL
jgi:16S rRNA (guanine966-N2)-methyltransferase